MAELASDPLVAIVGPCASGKSTLGKSLRARGLRVRITNPDYMIFLDASFEVSTHRKSLNWSEGEYEEEQRRLSDARRSCDLYLLTDRMSPEDVLRAVLDALGLEDRSAQGV
jgi:cytidylate kinase